MYRRALCLCVGTLLVGCSNQSPGGDTLDVSGYDRFTFSRAITIDSCFESGDLLSLELNHENDQPVLEFSMLEPADEAAAAECLAVNDEGHCLVEGKRITRTLESIEKEAVGRLFRRVIIAHEPDEWCGAGNVTVCSEDEFNWDGLYVSNDFCNSVYLQNGFEIMGLLEDLRDGPPEPSDSTQQLPSLTGRPLEIIRTLPILASDQLLGKNGDYVVVRSQSDLDGVLLRDGSTSVDFENEIAIAAVVIRGPCEEFTKLEGREYTLTVDIQGILQPDEDCSFDLGSIDAYLIVIRPTYKKIRLYLNDSELDEVHL